MITIVSRAVMSGMPKGGGQVHDSHWLRLDMSRVAACSPQTPIDAFKMGQEWLFYPAIDDVGASLVKFDGRSSRLSHLGVVLSHRESRGLADSRPCAAQGIYSL
ncbi:hypothetical protein J1614_004398 [Plenodomus biglobosus]|nr:hypothetical protein J1614_004398 [Plenodomus biglobosus]